MPESDELLLFLKKLLGKEVVETGLAGCKTRKSTLIGVHIDHSMITLMIENCRVYDVGNTLVSQQNEDTIMCHVSILSDISVGETARAYICYLNAIIG